MLDTVLVRGKRVVVYVVYVVVGGEVRECVLGAFGKSSIQTPSGFYEGFGKRGVLVVL